MAFPESIYLGALAREVVGGLESTSDTLLEGSITAVIGGQDGVLEATRVPDVDVQLAVLAGVGQSNAGANGGDVGIEDEGDDGAVRRDLAAHAALRTAASTIGDTLNGDLLCVSIGSM